MMRGTPRIVTGAMQAYTFSRRAWLLGTAQAGSACCWRGGWAGSRSRRTSKYSALSESNRVNMTLVPPRRGWLIDRHGLPIANNRTDFRVDIIPDRLQDAGARAGDCSPACSSCRPRRSSGYAST